MKSKEGSSAISYPWQDGSNLAVSLDTEALRIFETLGADIRRDASKARAWSNILILNDLKRRFPDRNPQELYEKLWQVSLSTPEAGSYVWNQEWRTMESSIWGHPGQPRTPALPTGVLERIKRANLSLTFENNGLRARAGYER
jgi:hypothetical protein